MLKKKKKVIIDPPFLDKEPEAEKSPAQYAVPCMANKDRVLKSLKVLKFDFPVLSDYADELYNFINK
jgi:hypothetical protein